MKEVCKILYGGDYNPNQWEEKDWEKDLDYLKAGGINSVTVNVFSWATLQPEEETYDFSQLDRIIKLCSDKGLDIVLGTATAAMPAWMFQRYPEVSRVDFDGRKRKFGKRHNACPNSLVYRKYSALLAEKLARRYGKESSVKLWHVNNEYGGACFCQNCEKAFRIWLRKRYGSLEKLNKAWNTEFWGHTIYSWEEIVAPNILSEANAWDDSAFDGISVDYRRFTSDSLLENFLAEKEAIRKYDKDTPITTNLMGTYKTVDYFKWGKEMDIVSWDNYPSDQDPKSLTAMKHDLNRGLRAGDPFLVMEQNPTQQTFVCYTKKEPGKMRALSYQAMAHGAKGLLFFQLKNSRGASEKYCGSVISHAGLKKTRVFEEVRQLGEELGRIPEDILSSRIQAETAVIFDWESYWSIEYDRNRGTNRLLDYVEAVHHHYRFFSENNIPADVISKEDEFDKYKLLIIPCLYMIDKITQQKLETYVKRGGTLVASYMSGMVDETTNVILGGYPGALRDILGIWVEEMDYIGEESSEVTLMDGKKYPVMQQCDIIHLEGAEACAAYSGERNYYFDTPAVTVNTCEAGKAYYIGTRLSEQGMDSLMRQICRNAEVSPLFEDGKGLEISKRQTDQADYYFCINFQKEPLEIPEALWGKKNLLNGKEVQKNQKIEQFGVMLIEERHAAG